MSRIQLTMVQEDEAHISFHVNLDPRGSTGYETSITLHNKDGEGWRAEMEFKDMPPQETPEDAVDRMGLYLREMAKAVKGKNVKHLNVDKLFKPVHR